MAEDKKLNLKKEKCWRLIFRILFVLIAIVSPIIIVSLKYKLITECTGYKLSLVGAVLCIVVVWNSRKRLFDWIYTWEYSVMKYILIGFSRVYIFIIMLVLLNMAKKGIEDLTFCIEWISLCECVAYLIIYPLEERHDHNVKRILRGIERKEDYKEAIKELQGGND